MVETPGKIRRKSFCPQVEPKIKNWPWRVLLRPMLRVVSLLVPAHLCKLGGICPAALYRNPACWQPSSSKWILPVLPQAVLRPYQAEGLAGVVEAAAVALAVLAVRLRMHHLLQSLLRRQRKSWDFPVRRANWRTQPFQDLLQRMTPSRNRLTAELDFTQACRPIPALTKNRKCRCSMTFPQLETCSRTGLNRRAEKIRCTARLLTTAGTSRLRMTCPNLEPARWR